MAEKRAGSSQPDFSAVPLADGGSDFVPAEGNSGMQIPKNTIIHCAIRRKYRSQVHIIRLCLFRFTDIG